MWNLAYSVHLARAFGTSKSQRHSQKYTCPILEFVTDHLDRWAIHSAPLDRQISGIHKPHRPCYPLGLQCQRSGVRIPNLTFEKTQKGIVLHDPILQSSFPCAISSYPCAIKHSADVDDHHMVAHCPAFQTMLDLVSYLANWAHGTIPSVGEVFCIFKRHSPCYPLGLQCQRFGVRNQ